MQTERSIDIDRPIDEVFEYTVNNVAEWSTIVVEDEVLERKPEGVGTTFRVVTSDGGRRMEFQGLVTRHEPPTAQAVTMIGTQFDVDVEYFFEDLSGRTRVTQRSTVTGKGFAKIMLAVLGRLMNKASGNALDKELAGLKRRLEAQTET